MLDDAAGHHQVRPLLPGTAGILVRMTPHAKVRVFDDSGSAVRIGHGGPRRDGGFSGGSPLNVDGLAELIAKATGTGVRHVLLAMGAGAPEVLEARLLKLATSASTSVRQQPFAS